MPSQDAVAFEHEAIKGLCAAFTAAGRVTRVVSWPDQDPDVELTVDSIVDIDGATWVVEHCRLAHASTFHPARLAAEGALNDPIGALAEQAGMVANLTIAPPIADRANRRAAREYYDRVIDLARTSFSKGPGIYQIEGDIFTMIEVVDTPASDDGRRVFIHSYFATHPGLAGQISASMTEALTKKLTRQLPRAKTAGYGVVLLLDKLRGPDQLVMSHFTASVPTIALAVEPLISDHPGVVDEVWVRELDGNYYQVLPPVGATAEYLSYLPRGARTVDASAPVRADANSVSSPPGRKQRRLRHWILWLLRRRRD
jgi:hypothetical protein